MTGNKRKTISVLGLRENPLKHIWVQVAYNSFVLQATKGDGVKFVQFNFSEKKKDSLVIKLTGKYTAILK